MPTILDSPTSYSILLDSIGCLSIPRIPELKQFDSAEHPLIIIPLGFSIRALLVSFVVLFQAVGLAILINIHMSQSDEMFDELEGMEEGGGEEQQNQEIPQEEVPAEDFPIDQDIDDLLGDAPLPDNDEMIEEDEERPQTAESREKSQEIEEDNGSKEDDESPIAPSNLGNAIDALMMNWCQLLTNVTVKPPVPTPSTLDHVKEGAEVCSKHFRDASVDVNNEFTRLGIQWEMEELMDQAVVEEKNLDEAIERQFKLMENAREIIKQRTEMYAQKCPEAGKHLTT
ncbi:hypothetical protein GCK72_019686 [Caenorhabditis remanei]|uniref:Uncharacterized protein n=1 Tax=Caenorhabditis remanei TaxID=31234 RepID=A0A6A5GDI9_CAERE|nr:hypothetical protein GCK72_019686 [Caenorhabditis remanei]KAF1753130.1 hypothetical protein GCK72_019686 [Caenorhabditis remanei]